jgi:hypothetical protein
MHSTFVSRGYDDAMYGLPPISNFALPANDASKAAIEIYESLRPRLLEIMRDSGTQDCFLSLVLRGRSKASAIPTVLVSGDDAIVQQADKIRTCLTDQLPCEIRHGRNQRYSAVDRNFYEKPPCGASIYRAESRLSAGSFGAIYGTRRRRRFLV